MREVMLKIVVLLQGLLVFFSMILSINVTFILFAAPRVSPMACVHPHLIPSM